MLSEQVQKLAQITDVAHLTFGESYSAQFHELIENLVLVTAPCGCVLAVGADGESLLTICQTEKCDFSWSAASQAWQFLWNATKPSKVPEITGVSVKADEPKELSDAPETT